ncbi:MAG: Holliday junction resolvase-like protein [Thermoplasmatota archaeon]
MSVFDSLGPWLVLLAVALAIVAVVLAYRLRGSRLEVAQVKSAKKSTEVRHGQVGESFAPWMKDWPLQPTTDFHFMGDPIDGVFFDFADSAIYLVEIKTGGSQLNDRQRAIKKMIEARRVGWLQFRIADAKGGPKFTRPWQTDERADAPSS